MSVGVGMMGGMEAATHPERRASLAKVHEGLGELRASGLVPSDPRDAIQLVRDLEGVGRVVYGLQAVAVGEIDRRGLFRADGHKSVRAMVGWAADLSPGDATKRARAARVLRDMPAVAAAVAAGAISVSTLDRIGVTHANTRVRDELVASDADLAVVAAAISYGHVHQYLKHWEAMADADGLRDKAERDHERRDFAIRQNLDGSFRFEGGCGSIQGTITLAIFQAYVTAEFEADLAEARARLGDGASLDDLCRTDQQRRMDALAAIFDDAVSARGERTGQQLITNLVIDHATLDRYAKTFTGEPLDPDPRLESWWQDLAAMHGTHETETAESPESEADDDVEAWTEPDDQTDDETEPEAGDAAAAGAHSEPEDQDGLVPTTGFRCSDLDGHPIDPTEATGFALLHTHIRRVVLGRDGVVLDMGRKRRVFTGARHTAVLLSSTTCCWPGCNAPASTCQADHMLPWAHPDKGRTDPGNGAPTCGKHNRFRNHGFTVHRDDDGTLHVHRPDGTRIE